MAGVTWSKSSAERAGQATKLVENRNISHAQRHKNLRHPRRGGQASASISGTFCLLLADIPPAELADDQGNCISGKANLAARFVRINDNFDLEPDPDFPDPVQGINFTLQTIEFHSGENVILPCDRVELNDTVAAVFKNRDTRARIGWDMNVEQADYHPAGSRDTQLGHGECQP